MSLAAAVNPTSAGFRGGLYAQSTPTSIGGAGFASPGQQAALPPGVPSGGQIIEARNNPGTNVRVPYARLVPLHARENVQIRGSNAKDPRVMVVNEKPELEYDGLKGGELAWVLGRRYKTVADGTGAPGAVLDELNDSQRYAHQAYAGLGNGVDRMQRLASTGWIEQMVKTRMGKVRVNLHEIVLGSDFQGSVDSQLSLYKTMLKGSTALHCVDLARELVKLNQGDPEMDKQLANMGTHGQGIFVLELGPFLRGMSVSYAPINVKAIPGMMPGTEVPRNLGDTCVFSAIEAEIRRRNLMDWTPDGVVLSKLESPTDEPHKSIEMDARSAQLFNVAIQGPAITTSWTSDVRDYKLECQPMDKVFICLVADLAWNSDVKTIQPEVNAAIAARDALFAAIKAYSKAVGEGKAASVTNPLKAAVTAAATAADAAGKKVATESGSFDDPPCLQAMDLVAAKRAALEAATTESARKTAQKEYDDEVAKLEKLKSFTFKDDADLKKALDTIRDVQNLIRTGKQFVAKAVLTNFRFMRSTSSHMVNYSNFVPGSDASRCGLKLGRVKTFAGAFGAEGCTEYILGAWCIGTVIDSAASRSTVGTLVRTAPTSMALNLNVNIEWWSGDRLYKSYMDDSGMTLIRGQNPPAPSTVHPKSLTLPDGSKKRARADADLDAEYTVGTDDPPDPAPSDLVDEAFGEDGFLKQGPGASRIRGSTAVPPTSRPRAGAGAASARRA